MKLVSDLNLQPFELQSFRDFYAEKNPSTDQQAIVVAIYYLRKSLGLNEEKITPHHVYTCFKEVSRRIPKNLPQSIRDTAKRKAWIDTSQRGNIQITTRGENLIELDLPNSNEA